jgi:hypothetical protein
MWPTLLLSCGENTVRWKWWLVWETGIWGILKLRIFIFYQKREGCARDSNQAEVIHKWDVSRMFSVPTGPDSQTVTGTWRVRLPSPSRCSLGRKQIRKPHSWEFLRFGWSPQPMETPTLKGGKDEREESHDRREGEGWCVWTHITPRYRHREQGILSQVYPHHGNRTVPIQQVRHRKWRIHALDRGNYVRGEGRPHHTDQIDRSWRFTTHGHSFLFCVERHWQREWEWESLDSCLTKLFNVTLVFLPYFLDYFP